MDRDIIAPGPDLHWHVSKLIDPRRSNGEKELADLSGKSLLLPKDRGFHPDAEGVEWRIKKLIRMNYSSLIRSIAGTTHRLRERLGPWPIKNGAFAIGLSVAGEADSPATPPNPNSKSRFRCACSNGRLTALPYRPFSYELKVPMHITPSKPLFNLTVPQPKTPVRRATPQSVSSRPKVSTEQALKGYAYLKSHSSRSSSAS